VPRGIEPAGLVDFLASELAEAPELWHQRAYLARVVTVSRDAGIRDEGVQPLAHALDAGGANAIILTLEADGSGAIYPVVYTRVGDAVSEHPLEPDPLLRYDTAATRKALAGPAGAVLAGQ
jgi:hypothetical protein